MTTEKVEIIPKIENGIVIDHIPAGVGPRILEVIRAVESLETMITLGLNFASTRLGRKDMIKIHDSDLPERVLEHLSLVAPGVTIKRVRNFRVDKKYVVTPPSELVGLVRCRNPNCLSNHEEGVRTRFVALDRPDAAEAWPGLPRLRYRCAFCERVFDVSDLEKLPST